MEPSQTHGTSPRQELTRPVGGRPVGLRPPDLLLGGREGANPLVGPRVANTEIPDIFTRLDAYRLYLNLAKQHGRRYRPPDLSLDERTLAIVNALGLPEELANEIGPRHVVSAFTSKCEGFYKSCKNHTNSFLKKHSPWLNQDMKQQFYQFLNTQPLNVTPISVPASPRRLVDPISGHLSPHSSDSDPEPYHTRSQGPVSIPKPPSPKPRVSKVYEQLSKRQQQRQRRKLEETLKGEPQAKLIKVFASTVEVNGEKLPKAASKDLEKVIYTCLESPNRASEISAMIKKESHPYTPEEALDLCEKLKLTARTYTSLQNDLKSKGYAAFPPYYRVIEAKKRRGDDNTGVLERDASISTSMEENENRSDQRVDESECDSYDPRFDFYLTNEEELFYSSPSSGISSPSPKSSPECTPTQNLS